jgi:hypothetical protein
MGRFNCLATLFLAGKLVKAAADTVRETIALRQVEKRAPQVCSASPVRDGILLRIAGTEVENVRRELQQQLDFVGELLGDNPWARKW